MPLGIDSLPLRANQRVLAGDIAAEEAASKVRPKQPSTQALIRGAASFFGTSAPANPVMGDIWFDSDDGNRIYRWNGSAWVDVQRVLELEDFGLGIKPVRILGTLPASGTEGDVVFLTTDSQLYRWTGAAWTLAVAAVNVTGQLTNSQLADIAAAKISGQLTNSQLADIASTKVTGQLTNSQLADIAAAKVTGTIVETQIANNAITTGKISAGSITTAKIAAGAITADEIATNAITAGKIIAGAITTAKIAAGAVSADEIATNAITTVKISAGAISTAKIAAGAVTADEIAANAITAVKIIAGAVTTTKLAAGAVTANELAANTITAGKIQAGAITADAIGANQIITSSANVGTATITSAAIVSLNAAQINAGNIGAINIARTGYIYNASYPARYFQPVEFNVGTGSNNWGTGTGFTFTHHTGLRFDMAGGSNTPIMNLSGGVARYLVFGTILSYTGNTTLYYRKNGSGSYVAALSQGTDDAGNARVRGFAQIGGLAETDYIQFFIAPCDANGDVMAANITQTYMLDIVSLNW